jgi:hypothetical protein
MTDWLHRLTGSQSRREQRVLRYIDRARKLCDENYHMQGADPATIVEVARMLQAEDRRSEQ